MIAHGIHSLTVNTYNKDIIDNLNHIADQIRIPDQLAGNAGGNGTASDGSKASKPCRRCHYVYLGIYLGIYVGVYEIRQKDSRSSASSTGQLNLYNNNIENEESWEQWKHIMTGPYPGFMADITDNLALYLYCKLN